MRGWIARLLLAAFVVRALIPAGYMPDFSAAADGVLKIVICSASGEKSMTLDGGQTRAPSHNPTSSHDGQPCAFSGLASATLIDVTIGPAHYVSMAASTVVAPRAVDVPPARAGPQLGSRGPPQLS